MSIEKINKGDDLSQSENIVETNIDKLKALFPEIVTEGKIDFKVLKEVLGEELEEGEEFYRFTWAGKANARREAQKPSTGTLRPAPEESVDWDTTQNLYIEGDNLEVLKLLQKGYAGKVKMIYIDPPYNTGNDFIYQDNYKDNLKNYKEITGQIDNEGNSNTTNTESDGRYHSNWLNMIYPRLRLARNLLSEDGLIFISIDENEIKNLWQVCDDIFGSDNYVEALVWKKRYGAGGGTKGFAKLHEYLLVFSKNPITNIEAPLSDDQKNSYTAKDDKYDTRGGYVTQPLATSSKGERKNLMYGIEHNGETIFPKKGSRWIWSQEKFKLAYDNNEVIINKTSNGHSVRFKQYLKDENGIVRKGKPLSIKSDIFNQDGTKELTELFGKKGIFDFPKPSDYIKYLLSIIVNDNDVNDFTILDFFSGSASSANAVMKLNAEDGGKRKFIQVQLQETISEKTTAYKNGYREISEIGKERIRRAAKKIAEEHPEKAKDLDLGFKVFQLDTSNIKGWDGNPDTLDESLFDAQDNIKTDRTEHDVLYEILLKYGLDLTLPIEEKQLAGKTVFNVGYGALFICLADNITNKVAEGIGAWKEESQPEVCRVVFKDSGFTDVEKTNSVQTLKRFGITEIKSI